MGAVAAASVARPAPRPQRREQLAMTAAGAALGAPVACMYCSVRVDKENVGGIGLFFLPLWVTPPPSSSLPSCASQGACGTPLWLRDAPPQRPRWGGGGWVRGGGASPTPPPPIHTVPRRCVHPPRIGRRSPTRTNQVRHAPPPSSCPPSAAAVAHAPLQARAKLIARWLGIRKCSDP